MKHVTFVLVNCVQKCGWLRQGVHNFIIKIYNSEFIYCKKMGMCYSCCKESSADFITPDMETRRQQQAQAAERRMKEQESRGIKDPERVKRMQQRSEEIEKRQDEALKYGTDAGLKWQVNN